MLDSIQVAIKELTIPMGEECLDGNLYREFQAEAFIQSLLDHPNCVKLYGVTANPPRMVLEFITGGDLCNKLHPKNAPQPTPQTFPWKERIMIAYDIAKGLHHLQSQIPPIIHRDIRSPNIFMTSDGRALLGDFGLARQVNPEIGLLFLISSFHSLLVLSSSSSTPFLASAPSPIPFSSLLSPCPLLFTHPFLPTHSHSCNSLSFFQLTLIPFTFYFVSLLLHVLLLFINLPIPSPIPPFTFPPGTDIYS